MKNSDDVLSYLIVFCFMVVLALVGAYWTADEWGWVINYTFNTHTHIPFITGLLINMIISAPAYTADFLITVCRFISFN